MLSSNEALKELTNHIKIRNTAMTQKKRKNLSYDDLTFNDL